MYLLLSQLPIKASNVVDSVERFAECRVRILEFMLRFQRQRRGNTLPEGFNRQKDLQSIPRVREEHESWKLC
jgi:hypothetical protein